MRASEVAQALNVPTVYIEEELELLAAGANGQYGLLRRLDDGRYAINIVLFDRDEAERAFAICNQAAPAGERPRSPRSWRKTRRPIWPIPI